MVVLPDIIQTFGPSILSSQAIKMNTVIDIAAIVAGIVEKARRQEQWMARLQNLKTCGDQVQAEFDRLTFYFDLTHKMRGINNFTSTDARWMINLAQKILTTLDDDLVILEKEIADLTLLHRRTGQKIVKEKFDMFYAIMVKELKYNVGCLQYAVDQVPDLEKIRREIRDHTGASKAQRQCCREEHFPVGGPAKAGPGLRNGRGAGRVTGRPSHKPDQKP
ncbi:unnamed protein product [Caenorhabditis auriculariae]|uniref:Uncharacterized protein n=1 Tax=Caenorhabditis auriculariae TaxID=2777116 RepID=A0A8S1HXJ2_9PELO|nr:unnamed protein product [Caenorhabditis auriculariae]